MDEVDFERDLAVGRTFPLKVVLLKLLSQLNTGTRDVRRDKGYGGGRLFVVSARTNKVINQASSSTCIKTRDISALGNTGT